MKIVDLFVLLLLLLGGSVFAASTYHQKAKHGRVDFLVAFRMMRRSMAAVFGILVVGLLWDLSRAPLATLVGFGAYIAVMLKNYSTELKVAMEPDWDSKISARAIVLCALLQLSIGIFGLFDFAVIVKNADDRAAASYACVVISLVVCNLLGPISTGYLAGRIARRAVFLNGALSPFLFIANDFLAVVKDGMAGQLFSSTGLSDIGLFFFVPAVGALAAALSKSRAARLPR